MSGEMEALAARVEAASGPDRELDKAIQAIIDPQHVAYMDAEYKDLHATITAMGEEACAHRLPGLADHVNTSPRYTGSIDAAMKLVPKGLMWTMDSWSASQWSAGIWRHQKGWLLRPDIDHQFRLPALALTGAALRARASLAREPGEGANG